VCVEFKEHKIFFFFLGGGGAGGRGLGGGGGGLRVVASGSSCCLPFLLPVSPTIPPFPLLSFVFSFPF